MLGISGLIVVLSGAIASTYGWGETMCGDEGSPQKCAKGHAKTASGEDFLPDQEASAAVAAPSYIRGRAVYAWMRPAGKNLACVRIRINDKMNQRFLPSKLGGESSSSEARGFDLTPVALRKLLQGTAQTSRFWKGNVEICGLEIEHGLVNLLPKEDWLMLARANILENAGRNQSVSMVSDRKDERPNNFSSLKSRKKVLDTLFMSSGKGITGFKSMLEIEASFQRQVSVQEFLSAGVRPQGQKVYILAQKLVKEGPQKYFAFR
jgi:hypothetical protein